MSLASFGVRKPVVANLLTVALLLGGFLFAPKLRREFFPEVRPSEVLVAAPYPGASPDEVEQSLAIKIEDALADLQDVKEIRSTVTEGAAVVRVEFEDGVPIDAAVADVKREVDALQDLPDQAERIVVRELEPSLPAVILTVHADLDERVLKEAARRYRDDLRSLPGMGDVVVSGTRTDEITVEVRPDALIQHNLSLPHVSQRIRDALAELPGGTLRADTQTIAVRTLAADETAAQIRDIVVKAAPGGQLLRVGDIADVRDAFVDLPVRSRLNAQPAVSLTCLKLGKRDIVNIAELTKAYAAGLNRQPLPLTLAERAASILTRPGDDAPVSNRIRAYRLGLSRPAPQANVTITTDLARFVQGRLSLLTRNAASGALCVFLCLLLFLNWRASIWVTSGMVVAIAGTLVAMYTLGLTLNLLSMFGLIVVVGILVDDGIVIAENIITRHEQGEPAAQAAINGAGEVAWPVVGTVTTTIVAFLPLALIQGQIGDFLRQLPFVATIALSVSMLEALIILPSHMAHSLARTDRARAAPRPSRLTRLDAACDRFRERLITTRLIAPYARLLNLCLRHRYLTLASITALLIITLGSAAGGRPEFIFFESDDAETINGAIRMPVGTPLDVTDAVVRRFEHAALALPEVKSCFANAGAVGDINGSGNDAQQTHLGQIIVELIPTEQRDRDSDAVVRDILARVGPVPGADSIRLEPVVGGPSGADIAYALVGDNPTTLTAASQQLKDALAEFEGVHSIADDADDGLPQLSIALKPGASELGFTPSNLGRQIRAAIFGLEAYTFAGDREDVDVRVTLPDSIRDNPAALERLQVFTPEGRPVPLAEVASLTPDRAYATVRRINQERAITVEADVDRTLANPELVAAKLAPRLDDILARHPGLRAIPQGRQEDIAESFSTLPLGLLVALALNYVILAWLFSSYLQPLVIMTSIPFALIGMVWGHILLGFTMTFLSLIGFVALTGIVVNDAIVFVEFYNTRIAQGDSRFEACLQAGRQRLRPIILTTLTTILGLAPLLLEQSLQARFLIPMAITISGGLLSSTILVLILLPCLLLILADINSFASTLWNARATPQTRAAPGAAAQSPAAVRSHEHHDHAP